MISQLHLISLSPKANVVLDPHTRCIALASNLASYDVDCNIILEQVVAKWLDDELWILDCDI